MVEVFGFGKETAICDYPLMKRLGSIWFLRMAQHLPSEVSEKLAGNLWIVAEKQ